MAKVDWTKLPPTPAEKALAAILRRDPNYTTDIKRKDGK